jgi:hypothetical protein
MFDRGDNRLECLIEETAALNVSLEPLSSIQVCCFLYQTFKSVVSSINHSSLLSPLSNIQGCCLLYQTFMSVVSPECLIEETVAWNV